MVNITATYEHATTEGRPLLDNRTVNPPGIVGCYIRTITEKKSLVVSLKDLDAKTN
jgi:hypothetical protein